MLYVCSDDNTGRWKATVIQLDVACHIQQFVSYISCGETQKKNRWMVLWAKAGIGANHFHTYFLSWHTVIYGSQSQLPRNLVNLFSCVLALEEILLQFEMSKIEFSQLKNFCESSLRPYHFFRSGYIAVILQLVFM